MASNAASLASEGVSSSSSSASSTSGSTKLAICIGASFVAGLGAAYLWRKKFNTREATDTLPSDAIDAQHAATDGGVSKTSVRILREESGLSQGRDRYSRVSALLNLKTEEEESSCWNSKVVVVVGLGGIGITLVRRHHEYYYIAQNNHRGSIR